MVKGDKYLKRANNGVERLISIVKDLDIVRETWLNKLIAEHRRNKIIILHGSSGQGKSSLCYRYMYNYITEGYRFVFSSAFLNVFNRKVEKGVIYPIKKEKVLKVTLTGLKPIDEHIENFSMKLHEYEIIHSSGLVLVKGKIFFECYLNLSLGDEKYKDLKTLLDKNKNKFKDIKIEEISLAKSKVN